MTLTAFYKQTINQRTQETRTLKNEIFKLKQILRNLRAEGNYDLNLEGEFFSKIQERKNIKEDSRYLYIAYATMRQQDLIQAEPKSSEPINPVRLENFMKRMESRLSSL
jgi:hypothetical protein